MKHPSRIVVVIEPHPQMARLFRVARRKAAEKKLGWEVLLIETPNMQRRYTPADQELLLTALTQAEQMGAVITKMSAASMTQGVKTLLDEHAAQDITTHSIIVANINTTKYKWFHGKSLATQLRSQLSDVSIITVGVGGDDHHRKWLLNLLRINTRDIALSLLAVALATGLIELIELVIPESIGPHNRNKSIVYMIACAFAASRYGLLAGIVASVFSFLLLNFMYMTPKFQLMINDRTDAVNLVLFLTAAIVISLLGSRDFSDKLTLTRRADRLSNLLSIHRNTLSNPTTEAAIKSLDRQFSDLLETNVSFFLPSVMDPHTLEILYIKDIELTEADERALQACWTEFKPAGVGTPEHPKDCGWRFEPLVTADGAIGVLGVEINKRVQLDINFGRLLSGIADQAALILEQLQLKQVAEETKIQAEKEKLRAMLLSSVSHDLKTPLASVIGSLSVYHGMKHKLNEDQRATLISTALKEAQRLDSFITNILDMTRIESGDIELKKEWVQPKKLVGSVVKRLKYRLSNHQINIIGGEEDIAVQMDHMMTGQVLQNLLDNAAKYTPEQTRIDISWQAGETFSLAVHDHGAGIPEHKLEKIFNKYERLHKQDSQVAGTGLGLAIAKAIMTSQGGDVTVVNHPAGGAVFTMTLPTWQPAEQKEAA